MKMLYSLALIFLLASCAKKNIKQNEGEALFFLYRTDPIESRKTLQIWPDPQKFIDANKSKLNTSQFKLIYFLEPDYLVFVLGQILKSDNYFVDKIFYQDQGQRLRIETKKYEDDGIQSKDSFYPIFVKHKNIRSIELTYEGQVVLETNLNEQFFDISLKQ